MTTTWTLQSAPLYPGSIWDDGDSSWDGGATVDDGSIWDAVTTSWTHQAASATSWINQPAM